MVTKDELLDLAQGRHDDNATDSAFRVAVAVISTATWQDLCRAVDILNDLDGCLEAAEEYVDDIQPGQTQQAAHELLDTAEADLHRIMRQLPDGQLPARPVADQKQDLDYETALQAAVQQVMGGERR